MGVKNIAKIQYYVIMVFLGLWSPLMGLWADNPPFRHLWLGTAGIVQSFNKTVPTIAQTRYSLAFGYALVVTNQITFKQSFGASLALPSIPDNFHLKRGYWGIPLSGSLELKPKPGGLSFESGLDLIFAKNFDIDLSFLAYRIFFIPWIKSAGPKPYGVGFPVALTIINGECEFGLSLALSLEWAPAAFTAAWRQKYPQLKAEADEI